jgi:hypothetical protein
MFKIQSIFFNLFFTIALITGLSSTSHASGVLPDTLDYTFKLYSVQGAFDTPMPVSFDGTYYWGASGGGTESPLQQYDATTGDVLTTYAPGPGIDFRSTFADASGNIFASGYSDYRIYPMTSPGVFDLVSTFSLLDVAPNEQAPVILSPDVTTYASRVGNTINLWSAVDGGWLSAITLTDYGNVAGEDAAGLGQSDLDLAAYGAYYLTYSESNNFVHAWDSAGNRVGSMELINNNNATAYSFGYSNGYIFTNYEANQQYTGYQLGSVGGAGVSAPEPGTLVLSALGIAGMVARRRKE